MSASHQKKLRQENGTDAAEVKKNQRLTEEQKEAKKLKIWTGIFYAALIATVIGLVIGGVWNSGLVHRTVTAVTVGDHKLSPAEMNYFYAESVQSDYFLPYTVDHEKPLDEQTYEEGVTFADHYMEDAVNRAKAVYSVYDEAMANNFVLSEEDESNITMELANMKGYAAMAGYGSASSLIRANYGIGCNAKTYEDHLRVTHIVSAYSQEKHDGFAPDADAIAAELEANPNTYNSYTYRMLNITKDSFYEGEPDAEGKYTEEQETAAQAAAVAAAEEKAAALKGDSKAFEAEDGAMLQERVAYDNAPESIREWLSDSSRKTGDTFTSENTTNGGCMVVMFEQAFDNTDIHPVNVRHILVKPEGEPDENQVYTPEQMSDAFMAGQEILDEWAAGDATEESFAELAVAKSSDTGSSSNGGLYENVAPGQMVEKFDEWCFDPARKAGDTGLVESQYGVHVMYFVGPSEMNYRDTMASQTVQDASFEEWSTQLREAMVSENGSAYGMVHTSIVVPAPEQ